MSSSVTVSMLLDISGTRSRTPVCADTAPLALSTEEMFASFLVLRELKLGVMNTSSYSSSGVVSIKLTVGVYPFRDTLPRE
jgi:hypothetical protein